MEFTPDNPFVFQDTDAGTNVSWYVQDSFSPLENLTLDLGLRFDRSSLPVPEHQFSPRIGGAWYLPSTRTVIRGSFNRLYMPPQLENLSPGQLDGGARSISFCQGRRGRARTTRKGERF